MDGEGERAKQPECLKLKVGERQMDTMSIPNLVIRRPSVVQVNKRLQRKATLETRFCNYVSCSVAGDYSGCMAHQRSL